MIEFPAVPTRRSKSGATLFLRKVSMLTIVEVSQSGLVLRI